METFENFNKKTFAQIQEMDRGGILDLKVEGDTGLWIRSEDSESLSAVKETEGGIVKEIQYGPKTYYLCSS